MKLATRISSIRRQAWKQCRSCSADSDSMWRDSLASCAARRVHPLAGGLEHRGHRVLREPVDLQVGMQRGAARARSRCRAGRGRARSARRGRARACARLRPRVQLRAAAAGRDELAQQPVDPHRVARVRAVAGALERDERAAGHLGELLADHERAGPRRSVAVDHQHRAADPRGTVARTPRASCSSRPSYGERERLRRRVEPPADAVLDLLGRVRLGEHLRRRRTRGSRGSPRASSGGCTWPSPRRSRAARRTASCTRAQRAGRTARRAR